MWLYRIIGEPWTPEHNCWWLVQEYFWNVHGISMPEVHVGQFDNVAAIKQASQESGWRPVEGKPQANDVLLMKGPNGRHVGVMVEADGKLGLLHSDGRMTARGPRGGVVWQSLSIAASDGYRDFEVWRRVQ